MAAINIFRHAFVYLPDMFVKYQHIILGVDLNKNNTSHWNTYWYTLLAHVTRSLSDSISMSLSWTSCRFSFRYSSYIVHAPIPTVTFLFLNCYRLKKLCICHFLLSTMLATFSKGLVYNWPDQIPMLNLLFYMHFGILSWWREVSAIFLWNYYQIYQGYVHCKTRRNLSCDCLA